MYKNYKDYNGEVNLFAIIRTTDMVCIPFDPANTDYQRYLEWLELGNTPEPAEEQLT